MNCFKVGRYGKLIKKKKGDFVMHKLKKILCILLCFSMIFSCVQTVHAEEAEEKKEYDIYPIVRDIDYDTNNEFFTMPESVNVVYGNKSGYEIDSYTKEYLAEVLTTDNGVKLNVVEESASEGWNILLGVNG